MAGEEDCQIFVEELSRSAQLLVRLTRSSCAPMVLGADFGLARGHYSRPPQSAPPGECGGAAPMCETVVVVVVVVGRVVGWSGVGGNKPRAPHPSHACARRGGGQDVRGGERGGARGGAGLHG